MQNISLGHIFAMLFYPALITLFIIFPDFMFGGGPDYSERSSDISEYDRGYMLAETIDVKSFDVCQSAFGTGDLEDGCNKYVKDTYTGNRSFGNYNCTEDCSGHEAGYTWAEDNEISDEDDCDGNSNSFIEGCMEYVDDNY